MYLLSLFLSAWYFKKRSCKILVARDQHRYSGWMAAAKAVTWLNVNDKQSRYRWRQAYVIARTKFMRSSSISSSCSVIAFGARALTSLAIKSSYIFALGLTSSTI